MKDYGVWFLTIAFGVCLFYVFNSLETQAVFQYLGSGPQAPTAQAIRELIGMLSVFVWVVLAFLILYASGFLIRRRKGELGTYLLLGMERGQVARLLLLETLCMGVRYALPKFTFSLCVYFTLPVIERVRYCTGLFPFNRDFILL